MTTQTTATEQLRAEAGRLWEVEKSLEVRRLAAIDQLAESERVAGVALVAEALDGKPSKSPTIRPSDVAASLRALDHAIIECRRRRGLAIDDSHRAEADELRGRAAALRSEVDMRQERVGQLLDELEGLEAWRFVAYPYSRRSDVLKMPAEDEGPMSSLQSREAAELERRAVEVERRARDGRGALNPAADVDSLLAALDKLGPLQLTPRPSVVREWAEARIAADRRQHLSPKRQYCITLAWLDGDRIDLERSVVEGSEPRTGEVIGVRDW